MNSTVDRQKELALKIAELCPGLFVIRPGTFTAKFVYWNDSGKPGSAVDPTSDLNAMHEAEATMTEEQQEAFNGFLDDPVNIRSSDGTSADYIWHATALQRAEAFVKTIEATSVQKS